MDSTLQSTFSQFHSQLDKTVVGYSAVRKDGASLWHDERIVVRATKESCFEWLTSNYSGAERDSLTAEPWTYGLMFRFGDDTPLSFILEDGALSRFQECIASDERFCPALTITNNDHGTLVAPEFDIDVQPIELFQPQLDSFVIGHGLLDGENQLVQKENGRRLLIGNIDEATAQATDSGARLIPFTGKMLLRHTDEGYRFQMDSIVHGRMSDWAKYQDFWDAAVADHQGGR